MGRAIFGTPSPTTDEQTTDEEGAGEEAGGEPMVEGGDEGSDPRPLAERYAEALIQEAGGESVIEPTYISALLLKVAQEEEEGGGQEGEEAGRMEQALCKLWDLSIDARVCALLLQLDALTLLEHIIVSPDAKPRIIEVTFGLLSNMASNDATAARLSCSLPMLHSLCRTTMTCTDPSAIAEALRFLTAAVMTVRPPSDQEQEPRGALEDLLDDEALLNQILCIWFNTLDADLWLRTSALLHALVFTRPHIASMLLELHLAPISCMVISQAVEKRQGVVIEEIVGMLHVLSATEAGSAKLRQEQNLAGALSLCVSALHVGALVVMENLWDDAPGGLPPLELSGELIEACVMHLSGEDEDVSDSAWWVLARACTQVEAAVIGGGNATAEPHADSGAGKIAKLAEGSRDALCCLCRNAEVLAEHCHASVGEKQFECLVAACHVIGACLSHDGGADTTTEGGGGVWGASSEGGVSRDEAASALRALQASLPSLPSAASG